MTSRTGKPIKEAIIASEMSDAKAAKKPLKTDRGSRSVKSGMPVSAAARESKASHLPSRGTFFTNVRECFPHFENESQPNPTGHM